MKSPAPLLNVDGLDVALPSPAEAPATRLTLEQQADLIGELCLHAARRLAIDESV